MSTVLNDERLRAHLSARLWSVLEERGLTQSDLARLIQEPDEGLQAARMRAHRYVHGLVTPDPCRLANLASRLNVSVDWLISSPRKKSRNVG